jgi:hypothetical protein
MLGFDVQTFPVHGLELYGSWTIDDVDFARWGTDWWGNKFIWQGGAVTSTLIPNTDLGIEYTRVEPYVYSHFFRNTTYTNNGYVIGADLPPNSDQWYAALTSWLSAGLQIRGTLQFRRHGNNEYDSDGAIVTNHGGDPAYTNNYETDSQSAPFLAGLRTNRTLTGLHVRYEPLRNYIIEIHYLYEHESSESLDGVEDRNYLTLVLRLEY